MWSKTITGYLSGRKKIHRVSLCQRTPKTGEQTVEKKHYCSLGAEVCQIQRVKKQKGCNLYWIISETTVKRLKEIIPFYHIYCLPLFRLTSLKAHFSLLITSFGGFCHLFVQDVAFLQRAHRDFSAELGCWSLQERKHQTSIQTGGEKNTSQTRPIQQQKHGQAPL